MNKDNQERRSFGTGGGGYGERNNSKSGRYDNENKRSVGFKDLDSNVIGLAYVAVMRPNVDSRYAAMIVQYLADSVNQIIVAHETGHTLGASHTADGAGIMGAALSNSVPTSFSEQSVTEISDHISRYSNTHTPRNKPSERFALGFLQKLLGILRICQTRRAHPNASAARRSPS